MSYVIFTLSFLFGSDSSSRRGDVRCYKVKSDPFVCLVRSTFQSSFII